MQKRKHQQMRRVAAMACAFWVAWGTPSLSEGQVDPDAAAPSVPPEGEQRRLAMEEILASAGQNLSGDLWRFRSPKTNMGDDPLPLYELMCGEAAAAGQASALGAIDDAMAWNYGEEETGRRCDSIAMPSPDEAVCMFRYSWDLYSVHFRRHDDGWHLFVVVISAADPDDEAYYSLERSWLDELWSDVGSRSCAEGAFVRPAPTMDEIRALEDAYESAAAAITLEDGMTQATACANDGSVEWCIPADDPAAVSTLTALSSAIGCGPGGGRARCHTGGLLLCSLDVGPYCATGSPMTAEGWQLLRQIDALPFVGPIVPTWYE